MSFRTRGPGPPPHDPPPPARPRPRRPRGPMAGLCTLAVLLLALAGALTPAAGAPNEKYSIATLCKDYFRQQQLRKIDGAELRSQNERNLNCVITFQTHSILQSFMLRFDELTLDCNDHLYIYDGAHAVGLAKWDLSCRDTREMVGPIHTRTNHVTLKYVTDNWGTENFGFNLIITAVKDPQTSCNDFKCKTREFCIHTDLVCDGVSHCADGSDETAGEKCGRGDIGLVLGMSVTYLVVACVSAVLILGLAGVGVVVCFYRQGPGPAQLAGNSFQPVHHGGLNGTGHTGAGLNHGNTSLPRGPGPGLGPPLGPQPLGGPPAHTLSLMQPGNWLCPVGTQLGYSAVWAHLYYCLAK